MADKWFVALGAYLVLFLGFIVPQIERHTQGSIVNFYESIEKEDCYVDVYKFKSYSQYFYTKIEPIIPSDGLYQVRNEKLNDMGVSSRIELNESERKIYSDHEMKWYLEGAIDKPVYLIAQPRKAQELADNDDFALVQNTGGYWVFKRKPAGR